MPRKYNCPFTEEELERAYITEGRTLKEMCDYVGIKSPITMAKVLNEMGISTDRNARIRSRNHSGMTDEEFKNWLILEYSSGASMIDIGQKIGISPSGVRKYFIKYGIERRPRTAFFQGSPSKNPNWRGGRRVKRSGYVEVYCPEHPNANKRKCVYEHQLVMEKAIGRYIAPGEVIHHIDGNKSNNDISNLLLLANSEHAKLHVKLKKKEGDQRV